MSQGLNSLGHKPCKDGDHIRYVLSCLPSRALPRVSEQRKRRLLPESGEPGHCGKGPAGSLGSAWAKVPTTADISSPYLKAYSSQTLVTCLMP